MLTLNNISKSYKLGKEEVPILKHINLTVQAGEFLAIMGPSGSGKSTLMNIIGCLDRPTSGTYTLDQIDILKGKDGALAEIRNESIGFVFQTFHLLPRLTALQNVELPMIYNKVKKKERRQRAYEALEKVGLKDRISYKPPKLSGGQKQRVAIARALVNQPRFILADEPTGALDTKSSEQILSLFSELHREGKTIIMITHDPDVAKKADRTVFIRDGELVLDERGISVMLEHIRISFQSIFSHKLRSILTMLGVIIGIAAIIAIVSMLKGQSEQLKQSMIGMGNNAINVVYQRLAEKRRAAALRCRMRPRRL